jgi:hypothetical protein
MMPQRLLKARVLLENSQHLPQRMYLLDRCAKPWIMAVINYNKPLKDGIS